MAFLGRTSGRLRELMEVLPTLPAKERPAAGQAANETRTAIEAALTARRSALEVVAPRVAADLTMPGRAYVARRSPPGDAGHRRDHRDLPRARLLRGPRSRGRVRVVQLHGAQLPARPPGARPARHAVPAGRLRPAHAHVTSPDPHPAALRAAGPRPRARATCTGATYSTHRTRQCLRRSKDSPSTRT